MCQQICGTDGEDVSGKCRRHRLGDERDSDAAQRTAEDAPCVHTFDAHRCLGQGEVQEVDGSHDEQYHAGYDEHAIDQAVALVHAVVYTGEIGLRHGCEAELHGTIGVTDFVPTACTPLRGHSIAELAEVRLAKRSKHGCRVGLCGQTNIAVEIIVVECPQVPVAEVLHHGVLEAAGLREVGIDAAYRDAVLPVP